MAAITFSGVLFGEIKEITLPDAVAQEVVMPAGAVIARVIVRGSDDGNSGDPVLVAMSGTDGEALTSATYERILPGANGNGLDYQVGSVLEPGRRSSSIFLQGTLGDVVSVYVHGA